MLPSPTRTTTMLLAPKAPGATYALEGVRVGDGVAVLVTVLVTVPEREGVPVFVDEDVPVCVVEGVPVWVDERVPVLEEEAVPVCVEEGVPVRVPVVVGV